MNNYWTSYNFDPIKNGDTFEVAEITVIQNGAAYDLTGVEIKMEVVNQAGTYVKTLTSDLDGGITITDAANGVFQIDEFELEWGAGIYNYDLRLTLADDTLITEMSGTFTVVKNVVR